MTPGKAWTTACCAFTIRKPQSSNGWPRLATPSIPRTIQMDIALTELANLYHTALIALDNPTRHDRLCYAAREFVKTHPGTSESTAYLMADHATKN